MAVTKKRLGRGLGNLISGGVAKQSSPEAEAPKKEKAEKAKSAPKPAAVAVNTKSQPKATEAKVAPVNRKLPPPGADDKEYLEIPVNDIVPNPYQPRREIEEDKVKELAESIRSEGLLQPIVVRAGQDSKYELIAGERRWRAHKYLGLKAVMARILNASDTSSAVISLIENLQREGLNPIEESLGYASLMKDFDLTQEAVGERVGKGRASIANALRLLQLEREIQGYLSKGMLSTGHAKVLLGLEDGAQRVWLSRRIIETGMSVRDTERHVRKMKNDAQLKTSGRSTSDAEETVIRDLEKQIATQLNTKVQLKHTPKKGRIVIEYYGNEDLQRILEKTGLQ